MKDITNGLDSEESRSFDVYEELHLLHSVLGAILRKYVPNNKKVELDLMRSSREVDLDIFVDENGSAKVSWKDA